MTLTRSEQDNDRTTIKKKKTNENGMKDISLVISEGL
jgi:hypothetical protein